MSILNRTIAEYEQIEETLSVLALDTVSNWILKHTSRDQLVGERMEKSAGARG